MPTTVHRIIEENRGLQLIFCFIEVVMFISFIVFTPLELNSWMARMGLRKWTSCGSIQVVEILFLV